MITTALILAAGLGTRLAPLSTLRAKAALPVAGEPIVRRVVRWLAGAGVRQVIVNLHHQPASITSVLGHGDDLGVTVRYSWESLVLGSAGGPARAFDLIDDERMFVVNGDTLTDLDLAALADDHARHHPLVTMASSCDARPGYNSLVVDGEERLTGVARAGTVAPPDASAGVSHVHFLGAQVVERRAFADVSREVATETVKWLYPRLTAADPASVRVWRSHASYRDVGTPAEYLQTVQAVAAEEGTGLDRGARVMVDPTADVSGSILWDDVRVGAGASVRHCVLADGAVVPPGQRIDHASVLGRPDGSLLVVPFAPLT